MIISKIFLNGDGITECMKERIWIVPFSTFLAYQTTKQPHNQTINDIEIHDQTADQNKN